MRGALARANPARRAEFGAQARPDAMAKLAASAQFAAPAQPAPTQPAARAAAAEWERLWRDYLRELEARGASHVH